MALIQQIVACEIRAYTKLCCIPRYIYIYYTCVYNVMCTIFSFTLAGSWLIATEYEFLTTHLDRCNWSVYNVICRNVSIIVFRVGFSINLLLGAAYCSVTNLTHTHNIQYASLYPIESHLVYLCKSISAFRPCNAK